MTSPLLVKARRDGREIVDVTPRARRLEACRLSRAASGRRRQRTPRHRRARAVPRGAGRHGRRRASAARPSPNSARATACLTSRAPAALYVPRASIRLDPRRRATAEVALCTAPSDARPRRCKRARPGQRCAAACAARAATRAMSATSCRTTTRRPRTCWWSRCDAGRPLVELPAAQARQRRRRRAETQLEETYYHRLNPPQGFAFQRVYTDDRSLDEAWRWRTTTW